MLIDQGGARIRERAMEARRGAFPVVPRTPEPKSIPECAVTVTVTETHDGKACDCIDQEMTLRVGDELTLDHVCNDGRVDKVVAKVKAIYIERAEPEHGQAAVKHHG